MNSYQELYTNPVPDRRVAGATVFSPDGKCLVTEGWQRLYVWEARTGKEIQILGGLAGGVGGMSFSPDGHQLAVADWHGKRVQIFAWNGEKLTEPRSLDGHRTTVEAVVYSPDGKYLASGDEEGFKLWNATTLEEIRTVETAARQLAFTPDSRTLWAATTNVPVRTAHSFTRWALDGTEKLPRVSVDVSPVPERAVHRLCRDGKVLFVARGGKAIYVQAIDAATGKERFPRQGHVAPLHVVAVSPSGRVVASAGEDRVVKLWDLATRRVRHSLKAHSATVCGLTFSPDGRQLASGSRDGTVVLWDVGSGTEVRALHGDAESFSRIQFSPDGRMLAAGRQNGLVQLWDAPTWKVRDPLPGHVGVVRCVAFSPDGKWLASGGEDKMVLLHPLAEGRLQTFKTPSAVNEVAFSPDSRTLAAVGAAPTPTVRLWGLETGKGTTCEVHTGEVHSLAFSSTASLLASCGEDGTVRLWDYSAGAPRVRVLGPGPFGGAVRSVAFTPDGRYLATANANGMVYLFRANRLATP
jgi:WD40 repeat protein